MIKSKITRMRIITALFCLVCSVIALAADANNMIIEKDVAYLPAGRAEKLDLYMPSDVNSAGDLPLVIFIHGGAWKGGDKLNPQTKNIAATLVENGYICASINYLLGTEQKPAWPQNLIDCKAAVVFLKKNAKKYNIDPNHIGAIGASAGAHLVAMLALTAQENLPDTPPPDKKYPPAVQAAVGLYGVYDFPTFEGREKYTKSLFSAKDFNDPQAWRMLSPLSHISANAPPFLLIHGSADNTVSQSQSIKFNEKLKAQKLDSTLLIVEGAPHSFALTPKQKDLRPVVINFFDKHLKRK